MNCWPIRTVTCTDWPRPDCADDIVEGMVRLIRKKPKPNLAWSGDSPDPGTSYAPYKIYNIGNNQPVELLRFIEVLEEKLGRKAKKEFLPLQAGDVPETYTDVDDCCGMSGSNLEASIEMKWGLERRLL